MKLSFNSKILVYLLFFPLLSAFLSGCKKFLEVPPPITSTNADVVFSTDASAIAVLTGIYISIVQSSDYSGLNSASLDLGLSADEFDIYSGYQDLSKIGFYKNDLTDQSGLWATCYTVIGSTNSAIEGLSNSKKLTPVVKSTLTGEAKFLRAFCFFYLVNLYGDIPMPLTTNFEVNNALHRSSKDEVFKQIVQDLQEAAALLPENYLDGTLSSTS